jgi:hypothetical protein
VGGKVLSYKFEGKTYDLGAIIIGDEKNYKNCHELLAAYDIPLEKFVAPDVAYLDGRRCFFEQYLKNHYSFARALRAFFNMSYRGFKFKKFIRGDAIPFSDWMWIRLL